MLGRYIDGLPDTANERVIRVGSGRAELTLAPAKRRGGGVVAAPRGRREPVAPRGAGSRRPPVALVALVAATALATGVAAQDARTAAPPVVEEVRVVGARALDADTLRAVVATRGARCRSPLLAPICAVADWRWVEWPTRLDTAVLRRDERAIRSLYAARGYPRAEVRAEVVPRGPGRVAVRFVVEEGPAQVVRSVAVRERSALPAGVEIPPLPLERGAPYSTARLEEAQRRIVSRLAEAGHPFAQVEVGGAVEGDSADVVLEVVPGPAGVFGPAEIVAAGPLAEREVRRRLAYRPGERFDPAALQRSLERLYSLPLVESVAVEPAPSRDSDSTVVPRLVVATRRVQGVQGDVTFSASDCLGGSGRWASRHFLGEPRVVSLSAGGSNLFADALSGSLCSGTAPGEFADLNYFVRAEWREPVGPDGWLALSLGFERLALARAYVRRGVQGRLSLARDLGDGWSGEVGYAPAWSDLAAVRPLYCVLQGSCAGPLPGGLDGRTVLAPLEVSARWSPRHARRVALGPLEAPAWMLPLAQRWLYAARASLAAAGGPTLSEFSYARLTAEGAATRFLGRRGEVAARLRVGALGDGAGIAPPQIRLYGGGPLGVRGVSPNLLGPEYLVVRGEAGALPCGARSGECEGAVVDPARVFRRPLGGELLLEAALEARYWVLRSIQLAAFIDAGGVTGERDLAPAGVTGSEWLVTPGVGALVVSPLGPVRVDAAYSTEREQRYPLVARQPEGDGYVYLGRVALERAGGWAEFLRRLRVQFYVGLPF